MIAPARIYAWPHRKFHLARVQEITWQPEAGSAARLVCPLPAIPAPGRYALAWDPEDAGAALAQVVFAAGLQDAFEADQLENSFLATPAAAGWQPGMQLHLSGPLGRGFTPPPGIRRLALAALGGALERLLPLAGLALHNGAAVAAFSDSPLPPLPPAIEVQPLSALPEAPGWADYLALDVPLQKLERLRPALGLPPEHNSLACPAQALVTAAMPCGGLGACGVCAVETRRGPRLACSDGPVFDLAELLR